VSNKRIDQLLSKGNKANGNKINGNELIPIFSNGKTERVSVDDLTTYSGFTGGGIITLPLESTSYKIFRANISDLTSITNPSMTILENTLGVTPTISYEATGSFHINSIGTFPLDNTTVVFGPLEGDGLVQKTGFHSADYIDWVTVSRGTGTPTDGLMLFMTVEVKVFGAGSIRG